MNRLLRVLLPLFAVISQPVMGNGPTPAALVNEAIGRDLPFELLPRDSSGELVSLESARAMATAEREQKASELLAAYFPPTSQGDPTRWRRVQEANGNWITLPNEDHPAYREFIQARDRSNEAINARYQKDYGDKYKAFAEAAFPTIEKTAGFIASFAIDSSPPKPGEEVPVRTEVREAIDALTDRPPWMPVARETATRIADQTSAVFDSIGTLGGYAAMADEAMLHEAAGKGSANAHFVKSVTVDYLKEKSLGQLTERFPKLGGLLEVMDVPAMVIEEMQNEMDTAQARDGNLWGAKARGIVNTIKKKTFIGTLERVLNEEGMAEVDNEMRTGSYSFAAVAYRTAAVTVGEVTQMNAVMRYGANTYYGVYEAEKAARLETQQLRDKLRAKTLSQDAGLESLRRHIIALQISSDAESPEVQAQISALQQRYEAGVRGMRELGGKMRRQFGVDDRQVEDLYKRSQIALEAQRSDLLEAKLIRVAAVKDSMTVETFLELRRLRDEYRQEVETFRDGLKRLHTYRGGEDPLVQEMMSRFRSMRQTAERMEAVEFDINDQRHRENEAARREREAELAGYAQLIRQQADRLPEGVSADDQALIVEMDQLHIEQERGEIAPDADLVAMAGVRLQRDIRYQELLRQQRDGTIAADADLLELLDGPTREDPPDEPPMELTAFAGLEAGLPGGEGAAIPEQDGDIETEIGEIEFEPAEPVLEIPPYAEPPKVSEFSDGSRMQYGQLDGKYHGATIRWANGQLVSNESYANGALHGPSRRYENGVLVRETFYLRGKEHGPIRTYRPDGTMGTESWMKNGRSHGWDRRFTPSGTVKFETLRLDGIERIQRTWDDSGDQLLREELAEADGFKRLIREWDPEDGILQTEQLWVYPQPDRGQASLERRRLGREEDLYSEIRRNKDSQLVGRQLTLQYLNLDGGQAILEEELLYDDDGHLLSSWRRVPGQGDLEEIHYKVVDGKSLLHGTCRQWFQPQDRENAFALQAVAEYRDGLLHGRYIRYRSKDPVDVMVEGPLQEGLRHGTWKASPSADLVVTADYSHGQLAGAQRIFRKGRLQDEVLLNSEGQAVRHRVWDGEGRPLKDLDGLIDLQFARQPVPPLDARFNAHLISFSDQSLPRSRTGNGRLISGHSKVWEVDRSSGQYYLRDDMQMQEGKLHGVHKWYYPNGQLREEKHAQAGVYHGVVKTWTQDGQLEAEVTYIHGVREGPGKWLDSRSGQLCAGELKDDVVMGWWFEYHPNGRVKRARHFLPLTQEQASDPNRRRTTNYRSRPDYAHDFGRLAGPLAVFDEAGQQTTLLYFIIKDGESKAVEESVFRDWCASNGGLNVPQRLPAL